MEDLRNYIFRQVAANQLSKEEAKRLLREIGQAEQQTEARPRAAQPIAIIGMACRVPGADRPEDFWRLLVNGVRTTGEFPAWRRRDTDPFLPPGEEYRKGGFLEHIDQFDAPFFRISRTEAEAMDPNQRLFLEVAWEAIEDAALGGRMLVGSKTAVYVGEEVLLYDQYHHLVSKGDEVKLVGSHTGVTASRIQYLLNLRGPSMVVDTACSSGLVALHLACQGMRAGEFEQALVGGIAVFPLPVAKDLAHESNTGIQRPFDKMANGTLWSEAVCALLLKPLEQALKDGDPIRAVVRGSAVNNDGLSNGLTAPNADAQAEVLKAAWEQAGISPETISYIETHGTGTKLGDPIEIRGITKAFRTYTAKRQFCGLGSVKGNIGHAVGAAGIASLIKAVLALEHGQLPPSIGFEQPNPFISFEDSPVYVNDRLCDWRRGEHPRRCGVSAFGFSGTNAHVVLEGAPAPVRQAHPDAGTHGPHLFTLSAKTETALRRSVQHHFDYLQTNPGVSLGDLCYTAATARGHYAHRLVFRPRTARELGQMLQAVLRLEWSEIGQRIFGAGYGVHKVVFHKQEKLPGELTEQDVSRLSAHINAKIAGAEQGLSGDLMDQLCQAYLEGADIQWGALYQGASYNALHLPVYPFDRLRYWAQMDAAALEAGVPVKRLAAPLLDRCLATTPEGSVYETDFRISEHWVLSEHQIDGQAVLPGTAYIEIAHEAAREHWGNSPVEVAELEFLVPFEVGENDLRTLQTLLKEEGDQLRVTMASRLPGEHQWTVHAAGLLIRRAGDAPTSVPMATIMARCPNPVAVPANTASEVGGIQFGPHYQNIRSMRTGDREALIELVLPAEYEREQGNFLVHPALLDRATGGFTGFLPGAGGLQMAFAYNGLRLYRPMPDRVYSHVMRLDSATSSLEEYRVRIFDPEGCCLAEVDRFTLVTVAGSGQAPFVYEVGWRETSAPEVGSGKDEAVCVLKDTAGLAAGLVDRLRTEGRRVVEVEWGPEYLRLGPDRYEISGTEADYRRLLDDTRECQWTRLFHLFAWNLEPAETAERLAENQQRGVYSLLRLSRGLMATAREVVLIAGHAPHVIDAGPEIMPENAALFGLGKVIGEEAPYLRCRAINLDPDTGLDCLWRELHVTDAPYMVAFRGGTRYVEEIRPVRQAEQSADRLTLTPGGVYLITGGTGGIGLEMARWLAAQQKVKIALLQRSPVPDRSQWAALAARESTGKEARQARLLLEIEALGSEVLPVRVDVSDGASLEIALRELRAHGPLKGILHGAGQAGEGFLIRKDEAVFRSVLAPKVEGTWLLDRMTREDEIDIFVLFSSVTAILGGAGQGDYTAANAYLDAFAASRSANGRRTLAINWPAWKETGMAVDYGVNQDSIFKALSTADALHWLDTALTLDRHRVVIGQLNYAGLAGELERSPILLSEEIRREVRRRTAGTRRRQTEPKVTASISVTLTGRPDGAYSEVERHLGAIWAEVLGLDTVSIFDNFYDLGGDSILAVRMVAAITKHFPVELDVSHLFDYPSVADFVHLLETMGAQPLPAAPAQSLPAAPAQSLPAAPAQPLPAAPRISAAAPQPVAAPAGTLPDQARVDFPATDLVGDLSWRQFNCYDRGLAILFGAVKASLIPYFKLLMGLKRGFDLTASGYPYLYETEQKIFSYMTDHQLLEKFGFRVRVTQVPELASLHDSICDLVAKGHLVLACFDEYYTYYSPFYRQEHTDHLTVIHGYDRRRRTYAILDHNHLQRDARQQTSYGPFFAPFATLEEIYAGLPAAARVLVTLEPLPDQAVNEQAMRAEILDLLRTLLHTEQPGRDVDIMVGDLIRPEAAGQDHQTELFIVLGAKELFLDTLLRHFCPDHLRGAMQATTAEIMGRSAKLVNKYVASLYRKVPIRPEEFQTARELMKAQITSMLSQALQAMEEAWAAEREETL